MSKHCVFNKLWLDSRLYPDFSGWLDSVPNDSTSAYCKICLKTIKLSNMGKQALISHSKGPKHEKNWTAKCLQPSISHFVKQTNSAEQQPVISPSCVEDSWSTSACISSSTPAVQQKSVKTFTFNEDDVTSAEIIWALQVVAEKMSLNSCDGNALAFRRMFPDSKIAQNFTMGKTKASYVINHGLAPYFKDCLQADLKDCDDYVVSFDESLNKFVQRGQMDIVIRFWDSKQYRVSTRYWNSVFLGRSTADHLLEAFIEGLSLPLKNILQISMDGPNVNLSFLKKFKDRLTVDNPEGKSLLDIGVCGLHTVNGAMKTAHSKTGWNIFSILKAMYDLFKNSPARRAMYTEITGSKNFPFKFTSVRWLENEPCIDQALKIYDHIEKFVKNTSILDNKNYQCIKEAINDPLLKAKLSAIKCIISDTESFLRRFQSPKPLAPFLFTALAELLENLLMRFVKREKILEANTVHKLMNLDLSDNENLIPIEKIDVGYGAKYLLKHNKCSQKDKLMFKTDFRKLLITMIEKLKEKSPLKSHFVRGLTCFDPKIIFQRPDLGLKRVDIVLEELHGTNRLNEKSVEKAKKQYLQLTQETQLNKQWERQFTDFIAQDNDTIGLDEFFHELIGDEKKYTDLWSTIKLCLILSHGNASVESGFSINKQLIVENLLENSLIAQRIIFDSVKSIGGPKNVTFTKNMFTYVRASRKKYQLYLDEKRAKNLEEDKRRQEKREFELELKDLEEHRKKMRLQREKEDVEIQKKQKLLENKKKKFD